VIEGDLETRVLHVEDKRDVAETTKLKLEAVGPFSVTFVTDPTTALERCESERVDCIVSDYEMPEMDGLELLAAVREGDDDVPFILFTGKGSETIASKAISEGVTDYLQKGIGEDTYTLLANRITNAVEQYWTEQKLQTQERLSNRIVAASPIAIVVYDVNGDVILANERAKELLGAAIEELDAAAYEEASWDLYDADGEYVTTEKLPSRRVIEGEEFRNEEHVVETGDGRRQSVFVYGAPLRDGDGVIDGAIIPFEARDR
jgi:PAS domain S-box-containing protein